MFRVSPQDEVLSGTSSVGRTLLGMLLPGQFTGSAYRRTRLPRRLKALVRVGWGRGPCGWKGKACSVLGEQGTLVEVRYCTLEDAIPLRQFF